MLNDLKIALLYGGISSEREISIKSGKAVEKALEKLKINFISIDPAEKQDFFEKIQKFNPDLSFIALHGKFGEDGIIQSILEFMGIKYTGSDPHTSFLCMNKYLTKKFLKNFGIPTPKDRLITKLEDLEKQSIDFPVVVKPNSEGSSIGVSIVHSKSELLNSIEKALSYDRNVLIEEYIDGRELTVGILNGEPLDIIEIKVEKGFYDYYNKYKSDSTKYICPAEIDKDLYIDIQNRAVEIYQILGCKGVARVDFILKDNTPYFLEINTVPGLTDHSLIPKAAKVKGISFEDLILKIIKGALNED